MALGYVQKDVYGGALFQGSRADPFLTHLPLGRLLGTVTAVGVILVLLRPQACKSALDRRASPMGWACRWPFAGALLLADTSFPLALFARYCRRFPD